MPSLGPLKPIAEFGVQLVTRFIVRNHQADVVDAIRNLYTRRLAWCAPDDPSRMPMIRARLDAERVASTYKGNPIGVPTFLLGGAVISGVASGLRVVAQAALGSRLAAALAVAIAFIVLGGLVVDDPAGRGRGPPPHPHHGAGPAEGAVGDDRPLRQAPEDDAQMFAVYAIILTVVGWLLIPLGVLFVFAAF